MFPYDSNTKNYVVYKVNSFVRNVPQKIKFTNVFQTIHLYSLDDVEGDII